ncbi:hypothetical protein E2I00_009474 [Balaenoptera physalus]|uniref:Uncharacterized protein n=1 Tax=Balaenoptera physalus TaxID=9770 RepID=A0A6A1QHU0_BALPH|nr:hypothetical protein E2I00_009474 [Balaenoptera physalus]
MLRAAWRALSPIRTQAVTQAPVLGLPGEGCAKLLSVQRDLPSRPGGFILRATRGYATQKPVQPSHEDDPPPSMLLKDYQDIPGIEKVDDVVKKLFIFGNGQPEREAKNQERAADEQGRGKP